MMQMDEPGSLCMSTCKEYIGVHVFIVDICSVIDKKKSPNLQVHLCLIAPA